MSSNERSNDRPLTLVERIERIERRIDAFQRQSESFQRKISEEFENQSKYLSKENITTLVSTTSIILKSYQELTDLIKQHNNSLPSANGTSSNSNTDNKIDDIQKQLVDIRTVLSIHNTELKKFSDSILLINNKLDTCLKELSGESISSLSDQKNLTESITSEPININNDSKVDAKPINNNNNEPFKPPMTLKPLEIVSSPPVISPSLPINPPNPPMILPLAPMISTGSSNHVWSTPAPVNGFNSSKSSQKSRK